MPSMSFYQSTPKEKGGRLVVKITRDELAFALGPDILTIIQVLTLVKLMF